ncbi:homing endonuclease associated repeat-containing protein [Halospeciosus flavus]|uniref:Homing endonuclease associated repeat-containing protein n=1 Tax=Halospeciosus flavus TaxID=3032283 RepID=A0ABD5Z6E1_9EURY|nr:hypothetical protein [Halospeciosus flavus]
MNESGPHSSTPYYNRFGSWNEALELAGFEPNHQEVSDGELLAELQRLEEELGHEPRIKDMDERGKFAATTYARRFGSWLEAREAAGQAGTAELLDGRAEREDLVEALQELAMDLGRSPSQKDMTEHGEYSVRPFYRVFGSWVDALDAAGMDPDVTQQKRN